MSRRQKARREKQLTYEQLRVRARQRVKDALRALGATVLGPLAGALTVCEEPADGAHVGAVDIARRRAWVNVERNLEYSVENWCYVLGHLALHVAFDHSARRERRDPLRWNLACEASVDSFLRSFKVGQCPVELERGDLGDLREEELYERAREDVSWRARVAAFTLAGPHRADLREDSDGTAASRTLLASASEESAERTAEELLAAGIRRGVERAIDEAASKLEGADVARATAVPRFAPIERARRWIFADLPLLGALLARLRVYADESLCDRMGIAIAAVDPGLGEIYVNPRWKFTDDEWLFVLAHELLHVALMHHSRARGRDPLLWNLAADFVINAWLLEMGVGAMPSVGMLFDPALLGRSVEDVYDAIAKNPRKSRGLRTLRGSEGDILWSNPRRGATVLRGDVQTLDDVYKRCLGLGLRCTARGRGIVPLGLLEEIESLFSPPVPWDVELARWMEAHVPYPRDPVRSYARASRRQSSTPDIPRPARFVPHEVREACTFGVILDSSGSMDRALLGRALGAIASFADSRDVPAARVVLCDARPYDRGMLTPEELRGAITVQGRGGTVLQPAIGYLCSQPDFPAGAPVMVITDGWCEQTLVCPREHCFVVPRNEKQMLLRTTAPVFYTLKEEHEPLDP